GPLDLRDEGRGWRDGLHGTGLAAGAAWCEGAHCRRGGCGVGYSVPQLRLLPLGLLLVWCAPGAARAQEPRRPRREAPGRDFGPDGVWRQQARAVRAMRSRLLAQRQFGALNAPLAAGVPTPSAAAVSGTLRVPAVLFSYAGTTPPPFASTAYDAVLFGTTPPFGRPYSYHSFYSQMSNGLLDVQGVTYGWVTLSKPEASYTGGTSSACQQTNPFRSTHCNGIRSGPAYAALPGHPGQFLQVRDYILQSGLGGSDSCTGADIMPIGTVAHETGHGFGLPDLYDTSDSTEGVGRWSLMGAGNFSSPSSPARMDAWSLSQLGWVTLAPLTTSGTYGFGAAPTSDTAFLVRPTGANPRGEYFLPEHRQALDAGGALLRNACQVWYQAPMPPQCSGGLLAWHVDSQQIAQHGFEFG